jgi:hypothetical protein
VLVNYQPQPWIEPRWLGLVLEQATDTLRCDPAEFQPYGLDNREAPYLGPVREDALGLMQWIGGMSLLMRRRSVVRFCQIALIASAILTTFEIGLRIAPSNLDPTWRWWLVVLYWVYAIVASAWLGVGQVRVDKSEKVLPERSPDVAQPDPTEPDRRGGDEIDSDGKQGPGLFD